MQRRIEKRHRPKYHLSGGVTCFLCLTFRWSLLHGAVLNYNEDLVKLLLECGASVDSVDKHGSTPLSYAASFGALECCELLLAAGADINSQNVDFQSHISRIPVYSGGGMQSLPTLTPRSDTIDEGNPKFRNRSCFISFTERRLHIN